MFCILFLSERARRYALSCVLGAVVVRAALPRWRGEVLVSTAQSAVLELFNAAETLTFGEIVAALTPPAAAAARGGTAAVAAAAAAVRARGGDISLVVQAALISLVAPAHALLTIALARSDKADLAATINSHTASLGGAEPLLIPAGAVVSINADFTASAGIVQLHRVRATAGGGDSQARAERRARGGAVFEFGGARAVWINSHASAS